jgi:hypothetical protein
MTIINDDSRVVTKWNFKLINATRGVIYDRHMFIVQPTAYFAAASVNKKSKVWKHCCQQASWRKVKEWSKKLKSEGPRTNPPPPGPENVEMKTSGFAWFAAKS